MNFKDMPNKVVYSVDEYQAISLLIEKDLKIARKHKDAAKARLHTVNFHPFGGQDNYCNGISGYVRHSRNSLAEKNIVFCKAILRFKTLHKNYEEFIKKVAKAEDQLYEFEKNLANEKNTSHQFLRKVVSKYGFKLWNSVFYKQDASASGKVLGNEVTVSYNKEANTFSLEIFHIEVTDIDKILSALKGLEKKA